MQRAHLKQPDDELAVPRQRRRRPALSDAITRRGDPYLRTLLVHGGPALLRAASMRQRAGHTLEPLHAWALNLAQRQGHNKAAVAVANKLARRLWALDHYGAAFDPHHTSRRLI